MLRAFGGRNAIAAQIAAPDCPPIAAPMAGARRRSPPQ
jgi:hypothetical protein